MTSTASYVIDPHLAPSIWIAYRNLLLECLCCNVERQATNDTITKTVTKEYAKREKNSIELGCEKFQIKEYFIERNQQR